MGIHIMTPFYVAVIVKPAYGPPTTAYFYPDPQPELTCCDGEARRGVWPPETWAVMRGSPGTFGGASGAEAPVAISATGDPPACFTEIRRGFLLFDTSTIPAGSAIDAARLRLYGTRQDVEAQWPNFAIGVVKSSPLSNTDIVAADYLNFYSTVISDTIKPADWELADYNYLTLTTEGLLAIIPDGITKLGLREAYYDASNRVPPGTGYRYGRIGWRCSEAAGLTQDPQLEVTYRPPL